MNNDIRTAELESAQIQNVNLPCEKVSIVINNATLGNNESGIEEIMPGDNIQVDNTDPKSPIISAVVPEPVKIVAGTNIQIDDTDPLAPVISAVGVAPALKAGTNIQIDYSNPALPVISSTGVVYATPDIADKFEADDVAISPKVLKHLLRQRVRMIDPDEIFGGSALFKADVTFFGIFASYVWGRFNWRPVGETHFATSAFVHLSKLGVYETFVQGLRPNTNYEVRAEVLDDTTRHWELTEWVEFNTGDAVLDDVDGMNIYGTEVKPGITPLNKDAFYTYAYGRFVGGTYIAQGYADSVQTKTFSTSDEWIAYQPVISTYPNEFELVTMTPFEIKLFTPYNKTLLVGDGANILVQDAEEKVNVIRAGKIDAIPVDQQRNPWVEKNAQFADKSIYGIEYLNEYFYAVGQDGIISRSEDGELWSQVSSDSEIVRFTSIAMGKNAIGDTLYIAAGQSMIGGTPHSVIKTSLSGKKWSEKILDILDSDIINKVVYFNKTWLLLGNRGAIATSKDGTIWTKQQLATLENPMVACFSEGTKDRWVIAGTNGFMASSIDNCVTWVDRPELANKGDITGLLAQDSDLSITINTPGMAQTGISRNEEWTWWLRPAGFDSSAIVALAENQKENLRVAVGGDGKIGSAAEGSDLQQRRSGTNYTLNAVACNDKGVFIVGGDNGTILKSELRYYKSLTCKDLSVVIGTLDIVNPRRIFAWGTEVRCRYSKDSSLGDFKQMNLTSIRGINGQVDATYERIEQKGSHTAIQIRFVGGGKLTRVKCNTWKRLV